jgi:lysophospholipase L1-like esterase
MSRALKLTLAPLLLAQALHTRRKLPRLPEAEGPRQGVEAPLASEAHAAPAPLRLLVLGDSSAAGVGVAFQHQALAQPLARLLAQPARHGAAGRSVHWRLVARSGITTAQAWPLLQQHGSAPADVAVVVTGVNDVVDQVRPARAVAEREALRQALRQSCGVRHTVFTPLPPMHRFAGLPQPLRWVAGRDAQAHAHALAEWAGHHADVSLLQLELPVQPGLLARDGFHPGAPVYALWAQALAAHIRRHGPALGG